MKVIIFGGSGFIGSVLKKEFEHVKMGVRDLSKVKEGTFFWDPITGELDPENLEGFDAIINLSGDNLGSLWWNDRKKTEVYESRIRTTALIVNTIRRMENPPKYLFNASGSNYYGNCGDKDVTEKNPPGIGFVASVAEKWEATARLAEGKVRVVYMRAGLVLGKDGGFLKKILTPFQMCLGGKLGSGQQWMSWIAVHEIAPIIRHLYTNNITGPVNFVSPKPVRNVEFTKTLADVLKRPAFLNISEWTLRLLVGQIADELMLSSTKLIPQVLLDSGYQFKYPELKNALEAELFGEYSLS